MVEKKVVDNVQDAPDTVYLAEDEASLYLQTTLQAIWAPRGQTPLIRSDTQRDKVYFYGTLNLHTGQEIVLLILPIYSVRGQRAAIRAGPDETIDHSSALIVDVRVN